MDAVYFQLGTLIMAGRVPGVRRDLPDAHTLGWGHAMEPGRVYKSCPSIAPERRDRMGGPYRRERRSRSGPRQAGGPPTLRPG